MNSKNGHRAKRGNCNALPAAEESEKTWETKKFRNRAPPLERRAPCAAFCSAGATCRWRRHSRSGTFNSPSSARAKKGHNPDREFNSARLDVICDERTDDITTFGVPVLSARL